MSSRRITVYVDAKIIGAHRKEGPKRAFVGFYVKSPHLQSARAIRADESDDAEVHAILFAIEKLEPKFKKLRIICDHQSVVSEATRDSAKNPSRLMSRLREVLKENPSIRLVQLKANPAHGVVTHYVNSIKMENLSEGEG